VEFNQAEELKAFVQVRSLLFVCFGLGQEFDGRRRVALV